MPETTTSASTAAHVNTYTYTVAKGTACVDKSVALPLSRPRSMDRLLEDDDERRDARSRSPMRVPAPMLQEERSTCSLCNRTPLTPAHRTDWNLWITFGQDRQAVLGATIYLGIFVRWSSVHYSTLRYPYVMIADDSIFST